MSEPKVPSLKFINCVCMCWPTTKNSQCTCVCHEGKNDRVFDGCVFSGGECKCPEEMF